MRHILLFIMVLWAGACPAQAGADPQFAKDTLTISTSGGAYKVTVEIAETRAQQARGLMHRETLPDGHGMLFIDEKDRNFRMWMKNTLIPLDMLFIDSEGWIVYIAERTTPGSREKIGSGQLVRAVLELPGGTVEKQGINLGNRVIHDKYFKP